eukprot:scaffold143111_cov17-Tisochrysis_lutea.AAC.1
MEHLLLAIGDPHWRKDGAAERGYRRWSEDAAADTARTAVRILACLPSMAAEGTAKGCSCQKHRPIGAEHQPTRIAGKTQQPRSASSW